MTELPPSLVAMLPVGTVRTWATIAPLVPESAYLVGGTALTVHLLHRVSRDLDFFLEQVEDLAALAHALEEAGPVVFDQRDQRTINCTFHDTKIQVLDASSQRLLRPAIPVGGAGGVPAAV